MSIDRNDAEEIETEARLLEVRRIAAKIAHMQASYAEACQDQIASYQGDDDATVQVLATRVFESGRLASQWIGIAGEASRTLALSTRRPQRDEPDDGLTM